MDVEPERIIVGNGTSPAMLLVFSLLVGEGDEVVLGAPHYPCYPNFIRMCGGVPVAVPMDPETGYVMDVEAVRRALTPRTRAIVVSSPANPTGAVQSEETMRGLVSLGVSRSSPMRSTTASSTTVQRSLRPFRSATTPTCSTVFRSAMR